MSQTTLTIPDDVEVSTDRFDVTVEGPDGSVTRRFWYPSVSVTVEDDEVVIESDNSDAKTAATVQTFESHLRNLFQGVTDPWEYELVVRYSHFPMQVKVEGDEVVIENFLGERAPRRTDIIGDTTVDVDGESVVCRGPDKEAVGQTAASIEQLTRVSGKDTRVFQDGVYITSKPGGVSP